MGQHFERGQTLFGLNRYREAIDEYQRNLAEEPGCVASRSNIASSLFNLGLIFEAEAAAVDAVAVDPTYAQAHYISSFIAQEQGNQAQALSSVREAIRLDPEAKYFCQLAELHYSEEQFAQALDATATALQLDPQFERALTFRAHVLNALGRSLEANELMQSALRRNPESGLVHAMIGRFAFRERRNAVALEFLENARRIDPVAYLNLDRLAVARGRQIWPFSVIDRALGRLQLWKPTRRWALVALITTYAVAIQLATFPASTATAFAIGVSYVVAACGFIIIWLPWTLDIPARIVAQLRYPREFQLQWRRLITRDLRAALFVIFVIVVPVTFLAAECAAAPAIAIGMAMIVVNYELLFALRSAFPKYGFMLLFAGSLGLWFLAKPTGEFILKNGIVALPLWIAIVAMSAAGPFYLRRLAAHPKSRKGDAP